MIVKYEELSAEQKATFDKISKDVEEKERKWFKKRGYSEADMMYADVSFREYLKSEESSEDKRPFDKAPGFRRMFIMGYFYGHETRWTSSEKQK